VFKKALVAQGGGPTAVINQSVIGVVLECRKFPQIERIYGALHGVRGIVDEELLDLTQETTQNLEMVADTPSSALGSTRDKPDEEYCKKILSIFEKHDVGYFFYIGGNDSSDTCRIVNELAKEAGYALHAFHVPKTIDNDLVENDHTPGYPSAARFVASAFMGDNLDNRALAGIKIDIVMGRHAGFLTAASVLARRFPGDGPHLIYVPETSLEIDDLAKDVEQVYARHGRCVVAVSEGVHAADGTPLAARLASAVEKDAHGNVQLSGSGALGDFLAAELRSRLGVNRVRADTFGYLQRSYPGSSSVVDQREARAVGAAAVEHALSGVREGSIAIRRKGDEPYEASFDRIELTDVAAKTRTMPPEFRAGSNDISDAFKAYLAPLVGELPVVEQL
jgi:6-phosphofructokinase 1